MRPQTETIVEKADFSEGNTKTIDIDLAGYVTEVNFRISLDVTRTTAGAAVEDGILRMIKGLKVTASNAKDWYSIRDGREGYYLAYLKTQGQVYNGTMPAAGAAETEVEAQFAFHPGVLPGNMFDITRCIPLRGMSNIQVEIDWGTAATDLGTGYSVASDSDGLRVEISRMILEKGESEAQAFSPLDHIFVPRLLPVTYPIDAIYSSFSFSKDILTGAYIRDVALLMLDSSGDRSAAEISEFRVATNKGDIYHVRRSWTAFEREVRRRLYLPATITGLGLIDFRNVGTQKDYGLNMVQASKGDWLLEFTTAATSGEIRALYEGADLVSVDPVEVGS